MQLLSSTWHQWDCLHGDEQNTCASLVRVNTALAWAYIVIHPRWMWPKSLVYLKMRYFRVRSPHLFLHLSKLKAELNLTFIKLQKALYCKRGMLCLFCVITHLPACLQFSIECILRCTNLAQCTFPEHSGWAEIPDFHAHVQNEVILRQPIKRLQTLDQGEDDSGH